MLGKNYGAFNPKLYGTSTDTNFTAPREKKINLNFLFSQNGVAKNVLTKAGNVPSFSFLSSFFLFLKCVFFWSCAGQ
jgi:hypothetical protein